MLTGAKIKLENNCKKKIIQSVKDHPERWRKVLEIALLDGEFSSEEEQFLNSALAIHNNYSEDLAIAESVLAGDAFIPMAIECLLDSKKEICDIESFLQEAVKQIDISS